MIGARPNFMKVAPVYTALEKYNNISQLLLHTGQHYDYNMSDIFFKQLELPAPNYNIGVSGGSSINQIGNGLLKIEDILIKEKPDLICVYGDINATTVASLAGISLGIKVAHIESGLRSFDRSMPEEINRIITDSLSSYLFTPSEDASQNLLKEGKEESNIFFCGNVMIDTLIKFLPVARKITPSLVIPEKFGIITLHRPSNVDNPEQLKQLLLTLSRIGEYFPLLFPLHPRTRAKLGESEWSKFKNILFIEPLSYLSFIALEEKASFIITDSGGVQEESTYLCVPCFTLRANTERPITVTEGTNTLIGTDLLNLEKTLLHFFVHGPKTYRVPDLWDGQAGLRTANILADILSNE